MSFLDLTGKKFGRLTVLRLGKKRGYTFIWICSCECGRTSQAQSGNLKSGHTKSCGCLRKEPQHGEKLRHGFSRYQDPLKRRFYQTFKGITERCLRVKCPYYKYYGGRGIKRSWKTFDEFKDDMWESYLDHIKTFGPKETFIDRIDNDGDYCKKNCRWATRKENANNRGNCILATISGETLNLTQWAERMNLGYKCLMRRIYYGWDVEKAILTPTRPHKAYKNSNS